MLGARYDDAAAAFERGLEVAPENPFVLLNLADARWLQHRTDDASDLYRRVLTILDADSAATGWQFLTVRAQALAHLGERREAVTALQEALLLAPQVGQAAFEAALVCAMVGDETAALVHTERAIKLGYRARWFRLPWFDQLRAYPDFVQLTSGRSGDHL